MLQFSLLIYIDELSIMKNPISRYTSYFSRTHIVLKLSYADNPEWEGVEGILIQANHAPFG